MTYSCGFNGFRTNLVVNLVSADEFHIDQLQPIGSGNEKYLVITIDIEKT